MRKQKKVESHTVAQQNVPHQNVPQKKKDIKTALRNLLVLVLVAAVSIVGTWAYLQSQTNKVVNTFTGSPGIGLTLKEESFRADMASSYTPEMTIPKDPTLTNTSETACEEWVAFRVDYVKDSDFDPATNPEETTRSWLERNIIEQLNIADGNWIKLKTQTKDGDAYKDTNYDIYLYKTKLGKVGTDGTPKATLFTQVKIKDQTTLASVFNADSNKYMDFKITLYGAAIKHDTSLTATEIDPSALTSYTIKMDDLTNMSASDDSKKIALALAKLLVNTPTTELNKDGTDK